MAEGAVLWWEWWGWCTRNGGTQVALVVGRGKNCTPLFGTYMDAKGMEGSEKWRAKGELGVEVSLPPPLGWMSMGDC